MSKEEISEYKRKFYLQNKPRLIKYKREYYEKNKIKDNERSRKYRLTHNKEMNEYNRNYNKNHPDKILEYGKTLLIKILESGKIKNINSVNELKYAYSVWSKNVRNRDRNKCQNCGKESNIAHHILYKSNYPELSLEINNGISLCTYCHKEVHLLRKPKNT